MRRLPAAEPRVESGPLQIGNDWPGTFFRGDESGGICDRLRGIAKMIRIGLGQHESISYSQYLDELADTFLQCQIKGKTDEQEAETTPQA